MHPKRPENSAITEPIPPPLREPLHRFMSALKSACATDLVSVVLFGSLARGDFNPHSSDANLLLIFKTVTPALLEKIAPALEAASREFDPSPLILAEADLPVCADVFPIKFRDIQRHHIVLLGKATLSSLNLTPERLRRQCQRELQNMLLRLRFVFMQKSKFPEALASALTQNASPFIHALAVVVELLGGEIPNSKPATISAASKLNLDCDVLHAISDLKQGAVAPSVDVLKTHYAAFLNLIEQTIGKLTPSNDLAR